MTKPFISVVAPVFNEMECLPVFYARICAVLDAYGKPFEIILVDDGSHDDSWACIKQLNRQDGRVSGVRFSRNFGQHQALTAGIDQAGGDWVVLMDCDLQDQPEEIPNLLNKAAEGFDIVLARRISRSDGVFKRCTSRLFYWVLNRLADIQIDETTANFGVYRHCVVDSLRAFNEHHRFIPGLVSWTGHEKGYVDVEHAGRHAGKTAYSVRRMWGLATNIILAHSDKPLRMSVHLGFSISIISAVVIFWLIIRRYLWAVPVAGWTSLMVSLYFVAGLLLANMGVAGLYIGRIFEEVKNRPLYLVRERIGSQPISGRDLA